MKKKSLKQSVYISESEANLLVKLKKDYEKKKLEKKEKRNNLNLFRQRKKRYAKQKKSFQEKIIKARLAFSTCHIQKGDLVRNNNSRSNKLYIVVDEPVVALSAFWPNMYYADKVTKGIPRSPYNFRVIWKVKLLCQTKNRPRVLNKSIEDNVFFLWEVLSRGNQVTLSSP